MIGVRPIAVNMVCQLRLLDLAICCRLDPERNTSREGLEEPAFYICAPLFVRADGPKSQGSEPYFQRLENALQCSAVLCLPPPIALQRLSRA
jgi:hypothetical protein